MRSYDQFYDQLRSVLWSAMGITREVVFHQGDIQC